MDIIYVMEFSDWINAQFMKWQGNRRRTISEFAAYLGVKQLALSTWMKQEKASKPDYKNAVKIAEKLGPEIYDVLGLQPELPTDEELKPIAELILSLPEDQRPVAREKIIELLQEMVKGEHQPD